MKNRTKKAVVLLSGGLDSAVTLFIARARGFFCHCLIFEYGQRHRKEVNCAKSLAGLLKLPYKVVKIDFPWKGSSLLDRKRSVISRNNERILRQAQDASSKDAEQSRSARQRNDIIPSTYVPGRNIIFLSFAVSYAEAIGAQAVFIGAHAQDYSGYPDCRPEFFRVFRNVILKGTKAGVEAKLIKIEAPLLDKNKSQIIRIGKDLKVPFDLTWSCYKGGIRPCAACDSCYYRAKGFKEAGFIDPLRKK